MEYIVICIVYYALIHREFYVLLLHMHQYIHTAQLTLLAIYTNPTDFRFKFPWYGFLRRVLLTTHTIKCDNDAVASEEFVVNVFALALPFPESIKFRARWRWLSSIFRQIYTVNLCFTQHVTHFNTCHFVASTHLFAHTYMILDGSVLNTDTRPHARINDSNCV